MDPREVERLLAETPDLEDDLREILAVDEENESWEFHDVPVDSGVFGELVSRGIVEKHDGDYRVADRAGVRAAIDGDSPSLAESGDVEDASTGAGWIDFEASTVDPTRIGSLVGTFLLVVAFRVFSYPAVFRDDVVLSANDPYYYRYWVERLAARPTGVLDGVSELPEAVANGEPLMVATLWAIGELLGGSTRAFGVLLAWYPVLSALATAPLVYAIATRLFDDRRVGLAAVVMFAITPAHAYRTSLGFADHHAFDYPWLVATVFALVVLAEGSGPLAERFRSVRSWGTIGLLGIGVAGQTLAWEAGPLLIGSLGLYVAIKALLDVRARRSPLVETGPLLAGVAVGATLAAAVHATLGWHADVVAFAPALLLVGLLGVAVAAEGVHRAGLSARLLGGLEIGGLAIGWIGLGILLPAYAARLSGRLESLLTTSGPAETMGLFSSDLGTLIGPIFVFGFVLFLGLPYLAWTSVAAYRENRPVWLLGSVYAWYFLALSVLQLRFAGEFAPVLALFAGAGFLDLLGRVDAIESVALFEAEPASWREVPDDERASPAVRWNAVRTTVLLFLLVGGLSFVQTPIKTNQLTIAESKYRTAAWIAEDAADAGTTYPENYVFSQWGRNRMYNYFVNGRSRSYGYARENFVPFLASTDGGRWYETLEGRVGYIVIGRVSNPRIEERHLYTRLFHHFGSRSDGVSGLGHYRAVGVADGGSPKVFVPVPGATITGNASPNRSVTVSTRVEIPGAEFRYVRRVTSNANGSYAVTVPYPGEYAVGNNTLRVPETAVKNGTEIGV